MGVRPRLGGVSGTPRLSGLRFSSAKEKDGEGGAPGQNPRTVADDSTPLDSFLAALLLKGVRWRTP